MMPMPAAAGVAVAAFVVAVVDFMVAACAPVAEAFGVALFMPGASAAAIVVPVVCTPVTR